MKSKFHNMIVMLALLVGISQAAAQGTAFSYQGELQFNDSPANGSYNLTFSLYSTNAGGVAVAGPATNNGVGVTNGLFTALIDFGPGVFTGASSWLEIGVATNGSDVFTTLTPRQLLTSTPQSVYAMNAGVAGVANAVSANAIVQGQSLMVGANEGMTGVYATITGGSNNSASGAAVVSGGTANTASGDHTTVTGGEQNAASGTHTVVGGGIQNSAGSDYSAVVGGMTNVIQSNASFSFIGAGDNNTIEPGAMESTIAGGSTNSIDTNAFNSTIGGGGNNNTGGPNATVAGGINNNAGGTNATVAGGANNNAGPSRGNGGGMRGGGNHSPGSRGGGQTVGGGEGNSAGGHQGGMRNGSSGSASGSDQTVSGGSGNMASGDQAFVGGGHQNAAEGDYAVVDGGITNDIETNANFAVIAGGGSNTIQSGAMEATIGGGSSNSIDTNASESTISGGSANTIQSGATEATIGGGSSNSIAMSASESTIGGGYGNTATGQYAAIPGGANNWAQGNYSFAAGQQAQALYQGDFVWADSQSAPFSSTVSNQFLVRANGGVVFSTTGAGMTMDGQSVLTGGSPGNGGGLSNLNAAQLTGAIPISSLPSGIPNSNLVGNGAFTVNYGPGMSGSGTGSLGGSITLSNTGVLSVSGSGDGYVTASSSKGNVTLDLGDVSANNIPGAIVARDTNGNFFAGSATLSGTLSAASLTGDGAGLANVSAVSLSTGAALGAGANNSVAPSATNAFMGGGQGNTTSGAYSFVGAGQSNDPGPYSFVVAGQGNACVASYSGIGGGYDNTILSNANYSFIGDGLGNSIQPGAVFSVIDGGFSNIINGMFSTVAGGAYNRISSNYATVSGGQLNQASNAYATVPGGYNNVAGGLSSFAAGRDAQALNAGAFVWADSTGGNFASTGNNQFLIRAEGYVGINTNNPQAPLHVAGSREGDSSQPIVLIENLDTTSNSSSALRVIAHGSPSQAALSVSVEGPSVAGSTNASGVLLAQFGNQHAYVSQLDLDGNWTATSFSGVFYGSSDRAAKENFQSVSPREVLDKVSALPISRWNYKTDKGKEHIGPMAQDFFQAFKVGLDDKHIATVDEEGVALAAIQGLNQKVEEQKDELKAKDAAIQSLEQRLEHVEKLVSAPPSQP